MMKKLIKKICNDKLGNVLAITSLAAPIIVGFAGLSVDVGYALYAKSKLQGGAEVAALDIMENYTPPNNFSISNAAGRRQGPLIESAIALSKEALPENHGNSAIQTGDIEMGMWNIEDETFTPDATGPIINGARVRGELSSERNNTVSTFFAKMFGFKPKLAADSFAIAPIIPNFHFLNPNMSGALRHSNGTLTDRSDLDIGDIWINSDAPDAFVASNIDSKFGATGAYIKGGATAYRDNYFEDLFRLPDLMADQPEPEAPVSCGATSSFFHRVYHNRVIDTSRDVTIFPGVYCGGLTISRAKSVTFRPGNYHFIDGPMTVGFPQASFVAGVDLRPIIRGKNVLLHFDGNNAVLNVQNAQMEFSGRRNGEQAGIFVFSSRTSTNGATHRFHRVWSHTVGLIYVPDNPIRVTNSTMNGNCHSLCVVADSLSATNGTHFNWYSTIPITKGGLGSEPRIAPTALRPYLKPYLISN